MTTTACDDQFASEPEPAHQPYDVAAILRKNIADLELELKRQKERAENAEAKLAGSREDLQSFMDSRDAWMARAHAAEAELKAAREQVPLTFVHDPNGYALDGKHTEIADALPVGTDLYARPIPAPAVPDDVLLCDTCGADCENNPWHYSKGDIRHLHACDKCYAVIRDAADKPAVPDIPDGDAFNGTTLHLIQCIEALVRINDCGVLVPHGIGGHARTLLLASANRLRQQPAPAVPEEWRDAAQRLIDAAGDKTCSAQRCHYPMDCCSNELIGAMDGLSALLQSAGGGK